MIKLINIGVLGLRFNHNKVLVDPYAKAIVRHAKWHDSMFAYKMGGDDGAFDVCSYINLLNIRWIHTLYYEISLFRILLNIHTPPPF